MRIAIFGTTGAGKSTLIKELTKQLNSVKKQYEVVDEYFEDCPYFSQGYNEIGDDNADKSSNFNLDIYFFTQRMKQFKDTQNHNNVIFDRCILDSIIFIETNYKTNTIQERDYYWLEDYFENVALKEIIDNEIKKTYDLVIYLKVDSSVAYERIQKRNRNEEIGVSFEYWNELNDSYEKWHQIYAQNLPFYVVDGNVNDPNIYANEIITKIKTLKGEN